MTGETPDQRQLIVSVARFGKVRIGMTESGFNAGLREVEMSAESALYFAESVRMAALAHLFAASTAVDVPAHGFRCTDVSVR